MKEAIVFVALALLIFATVAWPADVTLKEYARFQETEPMRHYIYGVGAGLEWANALLSTNGQPKLFCQPAKLILLGHNYIHILDREIELRWTGASSDDYVGHYVLKGLVRTFPCADAPKSR